MKVVLKSGGSSGFEDYIAKIPAGGVIFDEGEVGTEMFVIQSGTVENGRDPGLKHRQRDVSSPSARRRKCHS